MKIYDISTLIHKDMIVYKDKDEKKPKIEIVSDYNIGTHYETRALLDMHVGTHMDAPLHMLKGGDTIDNQDLYKCVTHCKVFDLTDVRERIELSDIESLNIKKDDFIIFKTRNSFLKEFDFKFVFISIDAANYLASIEIKGIGVDALSVERDQPKHETHEAFLKQEIAVLEGLNLKDIKEGEYFLVALPLKIKGGDGAPARAILIDGMF